MSNKKPANPVGRPPTARLLLSPEVRAFLKTKHNQSVFVDSLIRRDLGFIQGNWKGFDITAAED